MTSGGSRRRECPLPKKLPPFGHGPRDFWAKPKSCGYFSGAPPSIPPCGFAVLVIPGKKAGFAPTGAVCRSCTLHACLHQGSPTRRENRPGFPGSKVPGAGTLPVGFQGRSALVAPKGAKSRFGNLHTACITQHLTDSHQRLSELPEFCNPTSAFPRNSNLSPLFRT